MRTRKILKWSAGTLGTLVFLAALLFIHVWYFRPFSIDIFFERVFIQFALQEPELLSNIGILHQAGYRGLDDELSDLSPAHADEVARLTRRDVDQLHGYDRASLSKSQQLSYDVLDWFLKDNVDGERWLYHDYPVNQMGGEPNATVDFMTRIHPLNDAEDARNYNKRLAAFPKKFAGVLEGLKLRESKGVVPPKFVIARVLDLMRRFVATPARDNVLYVHLSEKLAKFRSLQSAERTQLLADTEKAIDTQVYPAYQELIAFFEHLDQKVQDDYGVWKLPDGDAYYDYLIHHHTTSMLDAQAVHDYGLSEVARLETEMDAILRAQGLIDGSIGARLTTLSEKPEYLYSDDDAGRKQCVADFQRIMDEVVSRVPSAFNAAPKLNVLVERMPSFNEPNYSGAYADAGSLDGSRPATFFVNLRDMKENPKWGMRTLAYHEGVPGHLLQGTYANRLEGVPTFRKVVPFTAYIEGWALYSEQLGWELGLESDALDNLGRLQLEMLRAARLVVDTGIHRKRWTREQSIDYMVDKTGRPRSEIVSEVERYFVLPGQALAYKIGMRKILELRGAAREKLGEAFDLKEFHRVVLASGALPLETLEAQVNAWVADRSARAGAQTASAPAERQP